MKIQVIKEKKKKDLIAVQLAQLNTRNERMHHLEKVLRVFFREL